MYLVKRHKTWWAMHDVPADAQHVLGRRLTRSLGTSDRAQAERLAGLLWLHEWDRRIKNARAAYNGGDDAEAALFRDMIKHAKTDEEHEVLVDHVARLAEDRYEKAKTPADREAALRFAAAAQGSLTPTAEHLDAWIAGLPDTEKTKAMKRSSILGLAKALPYAQEIDAKAAQEWLSEITKAGSLSGKTVGRILSFVRGYWAYLKGREVVTTDPFADLKPPATRRTASWLPFTPAQVVSLVKRAGANHDTELADLITLGMWTGARIEELSSLTVPAVYLKRKAFAIEDAKTEAGVREVPIHDALMPTLKRLIGKRKSGYVLADLKPNKYGDRSNAIGKRFGRLKKASGFGQAYVFHSIRKTVVTLLENAGVSENVAAGLVGHEKPRITYGLYLAGATLEVKRAALAKLKYPS